MQNQNSLQTFVTRLLLCGLLTCVLSGPQIAQASHQPTIKTGVAKYYAPGVFARVASVRKMKLRGDVAGYAATTDCWRIGQVIEARINGGPRERFQVLDCSHPRDRARHLRDGLVIEVDYQTARRQGFTRQGRAPATVYYP